MYLDEHHSFLRQGCGVYIFKKITGKTLKLMKREPSESELQSHKDMLDRALDLIEKRLKITKYLCGDKVSIADLSAACELEQSHFLELDLSQNWPKTK